MKGRIKFLIEDNERLKDLILKMHKDYGCELRDPYGTIWEHAAKVRKENELLKKRLLELEENQ